MAERIVKVITPHKRLALSSPSFTERRVAAYARVSTDSDEQMNSVEAQKDYFEKLIQEKPGWVLVGVYADEGISGTSIAHREAFNRMIDDAMSGKIDLIITKSLSRFARNTVDALNVIRKLKANGIGVYFEKENIDTLDSKGEFLITLMSSLAEEESRSISENVKWGHRKRFADGKYYMPYKNFLGYNRGINGEPEPVKEEARIVRFIYRLCLEGYAAANIAKQLTEASIPTPCGHSVWRARTIENILRNEKYYGAALLQKRYCEDFRTKKMKPNRGELPMYYVENGHEGIVTKDVFDAVQEKLNRPHRLTVSSLLFAGKLYCADCGSYYTRISVHSTTYNDYVWKCCNRHWNHSACDSPYIYEELLKPIFHEIIVAVLKENPGIIRECVSAINTVRGSKGSIAKHTVLDVVSAYDITNDSERRIWRTIVNKVIVHPGYRLEFHMMDNNKMEYRMMRTSPRMPKPTGCAEEDIYNDYVNGYRIDFLAQKYNFSINVIQRILKQHSQ